MKYCKDCVGFDECNTTGRTVEFAVDDGVCIDFDERKLQTNADRIRAMSEEELCNWLFQRDCTNIAAFFEPCGMGVMDAGQLLDWLKQSAEGE